ncbi:MAG TPA: efflux RND transporter permease subunit, partial [Saprospiraceae bacterium]|nr:efflux RND transporter permease subunit [Saprospiraceae bacterium]
KIKLKDNAYLLGFSLNSVMAQVRAAFFGAEAQRFQRGRDEIRVWVRYDISERKSIKSLDEMQLQTPSGQRVAFQEIATYEIERGEVSINHIYGKREIKVEANLINPKESASAILDDLKIDFIPKLKAKYPSIETLFEGQNRESDKIAKSAKLVLPIVLMLIYIVIAFTFRSYSQPVLLIIMVPFSLIGVGWGHYLHGFPINILSWLGIIALIGIMVNDGLVLIQKFNINLKNKMLFDDALIEAGKSRFRAIFLTSITTVAGLAPLIFETSRQAQFLIPMAIAIAYGITIATFLTLLTLPSLLYVNNTVKRFFKWLWTGTWPTKEEVENAILELENESDELDI